MSRINPSPYSQKYKTKTSNPGSPIIKQYEMMGTPLKSSYYNATALKPTVPILNYSPEKSIGCSVALTPAPALVGTLTSSIMPVARLASPISVPVPVPALVPAPVPVFAPAPVAVPAMPVPVPVAVPVVPHISLPEYENLKVQLMDVEAKHNFLQQENQRIRSEKLFWEDKGNELLAAKNLELAMMNQDFQTKLNNLQKASEQLEAELSEQLSVLDQKIDVQDEAMLEYMQNQFNLISEMADNENGLDEVQRNIEILELQKKQQEDNINLTQNNLNQINDALDKVNNENQGLDQDNKNLEAQNILLENNIKCLQDSIARQFNDYLRDKDIAEQNFNNTMNNLKADKEKQERDHEQSINCVKGQIGEQQKVLEEEAERNKNNYQKIKELEAQNDNAQKQLANWQQKAQELQDNKQKEIEQKAALLDKQIQDQIERNDQELQQNAQQFKKLSDIYNDKQNELQELEAKHAELAAEIQKQAFQTQEINTNIDRIREKSCNDKTFFENQNNNKDLIHKNQMNELRLMGQHELDKLNENIALLNNLNNSKQLEIQNNRQNLHQQVLNNQITSQNIQKIDQDAHAWRNKSQEIEERSKAILINNQIAQQQKLDQLNALSINQQQQLEADKIQLASLLNQKSQEQAIMLQDNQKLQGNVSNLNNILFAQQQETQKLASFHNVSALEKQRQADIINLNNAKIAEMKNSIDQTNITNLSQIQKLEFELGLTHQKIDQSRMESHNQEVAQGVQLQAQLFEQQQNALKSQIQTQYEQRQKDISELNKKIQDSNKEKSNLQSMYLGVRQQWK